MKFDIDGLQILSSSKYDFRETRLSETHTLLKRGSEILRVFSTSLLRVGSRLCRRCSGRLTG
jgi:hypothetical protein